MSRPRRRLVEKTPHGLVKGVVRAVVMAEAGHRLKVLRLRAAAKRRSPWAKGISASAVPWAMNTGQRQPAILSRLSNWLWTSQRAGR